MANPKKFYPERIELRNEIPHLTRDAKRRQQIRQSFIPFIWAMSVFAILWLAYFVWIHGVRIGGAYAFFEKWEEMKNGGTYTPIPIDEIQHYQHFPSEYYLVTHPNEEVIVDKKGIPAFNPSHTVLKSEHARAHDAELVQNKILGLLLPEHIIGQIKSNQHESSLDNTHAIPAQRLTFQTRGYSAKQIHSMVHPKLEKAGYQKIEYFLNLYNRGGKGLIEATGHSLKREIYITVQYSPEHDRTNWQYDLYNK